MSPKNTLRNLVRLFRKIALASVTDGYDVLLRYLSSLDLIGPSFSIALGESEHFLRGRVRESSKSFADVLVRMLVKYSGEPSA